eukprot:6404053-Pyramimonas_sp.AAC.1
MHKWFELSLYVCSVCGKTASTDFRHFSLPCQITRKGKANLSRISRGRHPRPQGAPKAVALAQRAFAGTASRSRPSGRAAGGDASS